MGLITTLIFYNTIILLTIVFVKKDFPGKPEQNKTPGCESIRG